MWCAQSLSGPPAACHQRLRVVHMDNKAFTLDTHNKVDTQAHIVRDVETTGSTATLKNIVVCVHRDAKNVTDVGFGPRFSAFGIRFESSDIVAVSDDLLCALYTPLLANKDTLVYVLLARNVIQRWVQDAAYVEPLVPPSVLAAFLTDPRNSVTVSLAMRQLAHTGVDLPIMKVDFVSAFVLSKIELCMRHNVDDEFGACVERVCKAAQTCLRQSSIRSPSELPP